MDSDESGVKGGEPNPLTMLELPWLSLPTECFDLDFQKGPDNFELNPNVPFRGDSGAGNDGLEDLPIAK